MKKQTVPIPEQTFANVRTPALTPGRQRLVALLGRVHFGRVEHLHVRDGEPVFDPPPTVTRTVKMNGSNAQRVTAMPTDFAMKSAMVELLDHLTQLRNGIVKRIELAHGLPLLAEIQDTVTS